MPQPFIKWGPNQLYQLAFSDNLDQRLAWTDLRPGYQTALSPSQAVAEQMWSLGTDAMVSGAFRFIHAADELNGGSDGAGGFLPVNGWDGPYGTKAWLSYARGLNPFRFYPDATDLTVSYLCYLVDPMTGAPEMDDDGRSKKLTFTFRTVAGDVIDTI